MGLLARAEGGADLAATIPPDVPVMFWGWRRGRSPTPIKPGDECLVIFADRCIDGWWWLVACGRRPRRATMTFPTGLFWLSEAKPSALAARASAPKACKPV